MAIISNGQADLFAIKRTLKEFNSLMKDIRIPNYSMAFTFCIDEDNISSVSKELKHTFDNEDEIGVFDGGGNSITVDYPEVTFHTQAVEGLTQQLVRANTRPYFAPSIPMIEIQEFVIFKYQMENKLQSVLSESNAAKNEKLSVSVELDAIVKDGHGVEHTASNQFVLNLQVFLVQL